MSTLDVPTARGDLPLRLNDQYAMRLRMRVFHGTDLAIELVTHYPNGLLTHATIVRVK
jgi:hypothetical protein